jgi:hypothetical protein
MIFKWFQTCNEPFQVDRPIFRCSFFIAVKIWWLLSRDRALALSSQCGIKLWSALDRSWFSESYLWTILFQP